MTNKTKIEPVLLAAKEETISKREQRRLFLSEQVMTSSFDYEPDEDCTLSTIASKYALSEMNTDKLSETSILEYLEEQFPTHSRVVLTLEPFTLNDIKECIKESLNCDMHEIPRENGVAADYWHLLTTYQRYDIRNGCDIGIDLIDLLIPRMSIVPEIEKQILDSDDIPNSVLDNAKQDIEMMNDPIWKAIVHKALYDKFPERFHNTHLIRLKASW